MATARRMGVVPPAPLGSDLGGNQWAFWFELVKNNLNVLYPNLGKLNEMAGNPSATQIPSGETAIWKNTTTNTTRLWVNDNGVLKGITLT